MKIQKFLHSCLLVEENGKRILIDPGHYSFDAGILKNLPKIDIILITHSHGDHCWHEAIQEIAKHDNPTIIGNSEVVVDLTEQKLLATEIKIPETIEIAGFTISSVISPHAPSSPITPPLCNGFYINHKFFHPGDSFAFIENLLKTPTVLALPLIGGWGTAMQSIETGLKVHPQHIIPIHDGFVTSDWVTTKYREHGKIYAESGIVFHPLKPGEVLEV